MNHRPHVAERQDTITAVVADVVPAAELPAFFDRAFSTLPDVLASQGVNPVGPAFALHRRPVDHTADLEVGFPVDRAVVADRGVVPSSLPGGRVVTGLHQGGFEGLPDAWQRLSDWIDGEGLVPGDATWEVYVTEPSPDMSPEDLRTELCWRLAEEADA